MLTRDVLLPPLARGLLVGGALVGPGLLLHAANSPFSTSVAVREVVFDLALGLLVVAPAALIERLVVDGRLRRAAAEPATFALAFVGATVAFLQGLYADAVLHTGSLEAGLAELTRGAGVLPRMKDLLVLFAAIAFVTAAHVRERLTTPAHPVARQLSVTLWAAVSGTLFLSPFYIGPLSLMLLALALLAPPLAIAADALVARPTDPP